MYTVELEVVLGDTVIAVALADILVTVIVLVVTEELVKFENLYNSEFVLQENRIS